MKKITPQNLVEMAQDLIEARYDKEHHHSVVAAALLTKSGHVYLGLNAGTNQPSVATCAEIIAIGTANTAEKNMKIDTIVALRDKPSYVISPCGKCREYIADYGPKATVLIPAQNKRGWTPVPIEKLLPHKYQKKTK